MVLSTIKKAPSSSAKKFGRIISIPTKQYKTKPGLTQPGFLYGGIPCLANYFVTATKFPLEVLLLGKWKYSWW